MNQNERTDPIESPPTDNKRFDTHPDSIRNIIKRMPENRIDPLITAQRESS